MRHGFIAFSIISLIAIANAGGFGQQPLNMPEIAAHHYEGFGQDGAAASIAQNAHVIIGFEAVRPKKWSGYNFDFPGGSISELLNLYEAQFPDYRWKQAGKNAFRIVRKEYGVSLADTIVHSAGTTSQIRQILWKEIWKFPEVESWMQAHHCSPLEIENGFESSSQNQLVTLEPGTVTLAELLDEIASQSSLSYWSITRSHQNTPCTISINVAK